MSGSVRPKTMALAIRGKMVIVMLQIIVDVLILVIFFLIKLTKNV